jgi:transcriptional regulator with XRE-family HTH domain
MNITELRSKRIAAEIPAIRVARQANIDRTRLSFIENGHVKPTEDELRQIETALGKLIAAKDAVREAAKAAGWPGVESQR